MQAPGTNPNDRRTGLDPDYVAALPVEISKRSSQCLENVFDSHPLVLPFVNGGVFQVEHYTGSAGIQHLHDEVGIVGRPGHLITLVLAPERTGFAEMRESAGK